MKKHLFWLLTFLFAFSVASLADSETSNVSEEEKYVVETISVGQPFNGYLINGIPFPNGEGYLLRHRSRIYATPELIEGTLYAINKVQEAYPNTALAYIGDITFPKGGKMRSHRSHQAGQDIDISMYHKNNRQVYGLLPMNSRNLDVEKTWLLIESLLEDDKVELIFLDYQIQSILYRYAKRVRGYDAETLKKVFQYPRGRRTPVGIIRWSKGHHDHLHVRFHARRSVEAANKYTPAELRRMRRMQPYHGFVAVDASSSNVEVREGIHTVQTGETLSRIASQYGVTISNICQINKRKQTTPILVGEKIQYRANVNPRLKVVTSQMVAMSESNHIVENFTHKVGPDETLESIAASYNITAQQICCWNETARNKKIEPGQTLLLYLNKPLFENAPDYCSIVGTVASSDDSIHASELEDVDEIRLDLPLSEFGLFVTDITPGL